MVTVVKRGPHPAVVKETVCRQCGATLAYVPRDIKTRRVSCMGDVETCHFIECPECNSDVEVR